MRPSVVASAHKSASPTGSDKNQFEKGPGCGPFSFVDGQFQTLGKNPRPGGLLRFLH